MAAAHYHLDNVCGIVDVNGLQIDGPVNRIMNVAPVAEKWAAFGWEAFTVDGHDFEDLVTALHSAEKIKHKPSVIIAKTVKGKGISFFEGKVAYHGVAPTDNELQQAMDELVPRA